MKLLMFAVALMGLASAVNAEDFQCVNDAGCTARITRDGEVVEESFRKWDMVSTEAGWVVQLDDGWEKVKTRDRAPNSPPPPSGPRTTFIYDPNYAGTTLSMGSSSIVFYGPQTLTGGAGTQGDKMEASWKHDADGAGPRQPVTITVSTERRAGETIREQARRFGAIVDEMQDLFPPNVPDQTP